MPLRSWHTSWFWSLAGRCHQIHLTVKYKGVILTPKLWSKPLLCLPLWMQISLFDQFLGTLHAPSAAMWASCRLANIPRHRLQSRLFTWDSKGCSRKNRSHLQFSPRTLREELSFYACSVLWGCVNQGQQTLHRTCCGKIGVEWQFTKLSVPLLLDTSK